MVALTLSGVAEAPAEASGKLLAEVLELLLRPDHVNPGQRFLGTLKTVAVELDAGEHRRIRDLRGPQREHLRHLVVRHGVDSDRIVVQLLERHVASGSVDRAGVAQLREHALNRLPEQGQGREPPADQFRRAQRKVPAYYLDLIPARHKPLLQMTD